MTQWYVKELSELTHVSVRTLHHYDSIDLLKPSACLHNGYRLYSEGDLLKLQQIIALKFFGFKLSQIKVLLAANVDVIGQFLVQSQFLQEKGKMYLDASETLKGIISSCSNDKSIPWKMIIKLIEVYKMTEQLKNTWAGKVLGPEELKEYASFEQSLKTRFSADEKKAFEQGWAALVGEIGINLDKDPASDFGRDIGKRCMDMINKLYGKKYAGLRTAVWEKGFKKGNMDAEHALPSEIVIWLDKATSEYYRSRLYAILEQAERDPFGPALELWKEALDEMHGDAQYLNDALYDIAMADTKVTPAAKAWIQKHFMK